MHLQINNKIAFTFVQKGFWFRKPIFKSTPGKQTLQYVILKYNHLWGLKKKVECKVSMKAENNNAEYIKAEYMKAEYSKAEYNKNRTQNMHITLNYNKERKFRTYVNNKVKCAQR